MKTMLMVIFTMAYVLGVLRAYSKNVDGGEAVTTTIALVTAFAGMLYVGCVA